MGNIFFAGTGLALPICIALVVGGSAMLAFKDQITNFIIKQGINVQNVDVKNGNH